MSQVCDKETDASDLGACRPNNPPAAQSNQAATSDPVNVVTGSFTLDEADLAIPCQRLMLALTRHYDSVQHNQSTVPGPFGWGWAHSLQLLVESGPKPGYYTYIDDRGARIIFKRDPATEQFIAPPGSLGLDFSLMDNGGFRLRQVDGLVAEFDRQGRILAMIRPGPSADSRLNFSYDNLGRLLHVEGAGRRAIHFYYQGESSLIRRMRDHTSREWHYNYDNGHLIEVRDPAGRVRRYAYLRNQHVNVTLRRDTPDATARKDAIISREIKGLTKVFRYHPAESDGPAIAEVTNSYTTEQRVYQQVDALGHVTRFDYNRFTRITAVTDPEGWTTLYAYDPAGNTTKIRRPEGGTTEYVFDERRNLLAEIDPLGNRTEYVDFKDSSRIDREFEFGRRALGNRSEYITISAAEITVGYDQRGNRPLVRDPLGQTYRYLDYNDFGKPQLIILPTGDEVRFTYDERSGLPLRMERTLGLGRPKPLRWLQVWNYDAWGNVIRQVEWAEDDRGHVDLRRVIEQAYDTLGHHPRSIRVWIDSGDGTSVFPSEEEFEWDELGRRIARRVLRRASPEAAPEVLVSRYGYDQIGRLIWEIAPDDTATCLKLDPDGHVVESYLVAQAIPTLLQNTPEDLRKLRRRWSYDVMSREISATDPSGATTTRSWDSRGLCTAVTAPTGYMVTYGYDRDNREILRRTGSGYELHFTYDAASRKIGEHDNMGMQRTWEYDAIGRVVQAGLGVEDQSRITTYAFRDAGLRAEVSYANGAYEQLFYDERGNLIQRERGPKPAYAEFFGRDSLGRVLEVRAGNPDDLRLQATFRYIDSRRLVESYDPLGNVRRSLYDTNDNLVHEIDAEDRRIDLVYDERGRLITRRSNDKSVQAQMQYDPAGQLVIAEEGPIRYHWQYDAAGRVVRHDQQLGQTIQTVSYQYDSSGRLTSKKAGNDWWMRFSYLPETPFVGRIELPERSIDLEMDQQGRVTGERWDDGGVTRYAYEPSGMLASLTSMDPQGHELFAQEFTYDHRLRPEKEIRRQPSQALHYHYAYDDLDRLERVERGSANALSMFRRYQYDALGNRVTEERDGKTHQSFQYDAANRLIDVRSGDGQVEHWKYDRCGNLIRQGQRQFSYDAAQRLRQVGLDNEPQPAARYAYSATGQRVLVVGASGPEHRIYDGLQEIIATSQMERRSTFWGLQIDSLLAQTRPNMRMPERVLTNAVGSVIGFADANQLADYDPFGVMLDDSPSKLSFGFAGKRYDMASGFYDNRARQYDPHHGRFTQPDPLGMVDGPNVYAYARNNPIVYSDFLGFEAEQNAQGSISHGQTLFHYTTEAGLLGILETQQLNPSSRANNPRDARHGDGVYLTDISPDMINKQYTREQLARRIYGQPFPNQIMRSTHYIEIDVSGLDVKYPDPNKWPNIFVINTTTPIDLRGRIVTYGATPT